MDNFSLMINIIINVFFNLLIQYIGFKLFSFLFVNLCIYLFYIFFEIFTIIRVIYYINFKSNDKNFLLWYNNYLKWKKFN